MTIAVAAGNDCWRYYKTGILKSTSSCGNYTRLDHGVVLVGLVQAESNDDDDDDDDDDDEEPVETKRSCRKATRMERRAK